MELADFPFAELLFHHDLVIFDGHCNFCSGRINFLIRRDTQKRFLVTASQSPAGQAILSYLGKDPLDVSTVYLITQDGVHTESEAVLRIASHLGFPLTLMRAFRIFPASLRDPVYRWVARNRYRWFGRSETCRLPTADERARFLP